MVPSGPAIADIRERVIWVINDFVDTWRRYPYLEMRTGIAARKWQNVCNRAQQPSIEMIAALAEYRPHLVVWMVTGKTVRGPQVDPTEDGWEEGWIDDLLSAYTWKPSAAKKPPSSRVLADEDVRVSPKKPHGKLPANPANAAPRSARARSKK